MSSDADVPGTPGVLATGIETTIAALRTHGAAQRDPVRWHFIEALAKRAAGQQGETRRLLDDKLAGLLAAYGADVDAEPCESAAAAEAVTATSSMAAAPAPAPSLAAVVPPSPRLAPPAPPLRAAAGPLATLVNQLAERNSPPVSPRHSKDAPTASPRPSAASPSALSAPPELKALSYFRSTWSRLSTEQRLAQSAAKLPENAGPLNSQHLVHQSLVLMRELSPGYLERFIAHVDALLWLDQLHSGGTANK
jgi:hypothetical protein